VPSTRVGATSRKVAPGVAGAYEAREEQVREIRR
jgi:hypothetical protein